MVIIMIRTCDMKGGIAAMLKAVSEIDFSKLSTGLMLIFTYGEEKDFSGIKYFVNSKIKYPNYLILENQQIIFL